MSSFAPTTDQAAKPSKPAVIDPIKLQIGKLCDLENAVRIAFEPHDIQTSAWGNGKELVSTLPVGSGEGEYHLFLDDRGTLVGIVTIIRDGLDLRPYSVIQQWLTRTKKTDFIVESAVDPSAQGIRHASYHVHREREKVHGVVVLSRDGASLLYIDSRVLPGFSSILAANSARFLKRIDRIHAASLSAEKQNLVAFQHFAAAEVSRVGFCSAPDPARAVKGYDAALKLGFDDLLYQAEAHHRTGLAYRDQEMFSEAISALQRSLEIRPSIAEVHHHLGTVYERMNDAEHAIEGYLTAVRLRPNFLVARYHLAAVYANVNPKKSIREFETYVVLAEDNKGEQDRLQRAKEYLLKLKQTR